MDVRSTPQVKGLRDRTNQINRGSQLRVADTATVRSLKRAYIIDRNHTRDDYETPSETAIRLVLLVITAAVVLFAAYQL